METITVEGMEVRFDELTEETQIRLYQSNPKRLEKEASTSKYKKVRELVIKNEETSETVLKEMFQQAVKNKEEQVVCKLWNHPNFTKNDEEKRMFATVSVSTFFDIIQDSEASSKLLNQIFRDEIETSCGAWAGKYFIMQNPNFQMEEETKERLIESFYKEDRIFVVKETAATSTLLNKMLRKEIELYQEQDVIDEIMERPNFQIEEKTKKAMRKSRMETMRVLIARDTATTSQLLNKMLRKEVTEYKSKFIMKAILGNPNFQLEEKTKQLLSNPKHEYYKRYVENFYN